MPAAKVDSKGQCRLHGRRQFVKLCACLYGYQAMHSPSARRRGVAPCSAQCRLRSHRRPLVKVFVRRRPAASHGIDFCVAVLATRA
eukprot:7263354-Prymnesium_polylepis.1